MLMSVQSASAAELAESQVAQPAPAAIIIQAKSQPKAEALDAAQHHEQQGDQSQHPSAQSHHESSQPASAAMQMADSAAQSQPRARARAPSAPLSQAMAINVHDILMQAHFQMVDAAEPEPAHAINQSAIAAQAIAAASPIVHANCNPSPAVHGTDQASAAAAAAASIPAAATEFEFQQQRIDKLQRMLEALQHQMKLQAEQDRH